MGQIPEPEGAENAPQGSVDGFATSRSVAHIIVGLVENNTADTRSLDFFDGAQQAGLRIHPEQNQVAGIFWWLKVRTRFQAGMAHLYQLIG